MSAKDKDVGTQKKITKRMSTLDTTRKITPTVLCVKINAIPIQTAELLNVVEIMMYVLGGQSVNAVV